MHFYAYCHEFSSWSAGHDIQKNFHCYKICWWCFAFSFVVEDVAAYTHACSVFFYFLRPDGTCYLAASNLFVFVHLAVVDECHEVSALKVLDTLS